METREKQEQPLRRGEWEEKLKRWEESGLNGAAWCRRESISYQTFCNWKKRLVQKKAGSKRATDSFLELKAEERGGIVLEYQEMRIHLDRDFDALALKQCLRAVKEFAC